MHDSKKALRDGSLYSPDAYSHSGAGGIQLWVDPAYDVVGVFCSVVLEGLAGPRTKSCADLFMNAVTAAVTDA